MMLNSISITPVSNGFLVYLPPVVEDPTSVIFRKLPSIVRGIQKDDQLAELGVQNTDTEPETTYKKMVREKNYHIFKTWDETVAFLKVIFEEEN